MARMIPPSVSETTKSYAERLMFEKTSAELAITLFLLQDELRARTETSDE